jgi:hypothetical protein
MPSEASLCQSQRGGLRVVCLFLLTKNWRHSYLRRLMDGITLNYGANLLCLSNRWRLGKVFFFREFGIP